MAQCYGLLLDLVTRRVRMAWWWTVEGEECPIELELDQDMLIVHMEGALSLEKFYALQRAQLATLGLPVESEALMRSLGAELIEIRLADLPTVPPGTVRCYMPGRRGIYHRPHRDWEDEWSEWLLSGQHGPEPQPTVVVRTERREYPDGSVETRTVRDFPKYIKVRQFPRQVVTTPGPP